MLGCGRDCQLFTLIMRFYFLQNWFITQWGIKYIYLSCLTFLASLYYFKNDSALLANNDNNVSQESKNAVNVTYSCVGVKSTVWPDFVNVQFGMDSRDFFFWFPRLCFWRHFAFIFFRWFLAYKSIYAGVFKHLFYLFHIWLKKWENHM